jgi:hypothetical protein
MIAREKEDYHLLDVLPHEVQSLFNTFDIMSMPGASRKQRPISPWQSETSARDVLLNAFVSIAPSTLKLRFGSSYESNRWEINSRFEGHAMVTNFLPMSLATHRLLQRVYPALSP